jgi:hypothetical protein
MIGAAFMALGVLASAIDWGWQPMADGGREYIVQVEPQLTDIDAFRKEGFSSDIPPQLRDIRRIRIVVGSDPLPNQGEIPPAALQGPGVGGQGPGDTVTAPVPPPPGALPDGVAAEPLKTARPSESPSGKVALADGHQPADTAANGSDPTNNAAIPATSSAQPRSPSDGPVGDDAPPASTTTPPRPWTTLLAVAGVLIVSLSANVFLGWVHWGARNQYRALVSQLRAQRSA